MKKVKIRIINSKKLINFISKFKAFDQNVLLEINGKEDIVVKSFRSTKTAVKWGKIKLDSIVDLEKSTLNDEDKILVGIYNIDLFSKMVENIDEEYFDMLLEYNEKDECFTDKMVLKSDTLKLNIPNAEKIMFARIKDEIIENIFSLENSMFNFKLDSTLLSKLTTLANFDKNNKTIKFKFNKSNDSEDALLFSGKNFDLKFPNDIKLKKDSLEVVIDKTFLTYLDKNVYETYGFEEQIYFFSVDEDIETKVVFAGYVDIE